MDCKLYSVVDLEGNIKTESLESNCFFRNVTCKCQQISHHPTATSSHAGFILQFSHRFSLENKTPFEMYSLRHQARFIWA